MPSPSKRQFLIDNIPQIEAWAAEGLYNTEIMVRLQIKPSKFYFYLKEIPELAEALEVARFNNLAEQVAKIEESLIKRACGYEVNETTVETKIMGGRRVNGKLEDGKETVVKKTVNKHIPGDTSAAIFLLKALAPQRYLKIQNAINLQINQYDSIVDGISEDNLLKIQDLIEHTPIDTVVIQDSDIEFKDITNNVVTTEVDDSEDDNN